jgi:hypothetical protein
MYITSTPIGVIKKQALSVLVEYVYVPQVLSTTNKIQSYTIFLIIVSALHGSGGFSVHHQELKNCTYIIWYVPGLLAATASGNSKQAWHIQDAVCTVLELLMMDGETARNM